MGELVDEHTVLVGRYIQTQGGILKDSSVTPQVWTSGRVESVLVTVSNTGHRLVKVRITQDRIPELGDKFSNRHGQKGTIGMFIRGEDMPRTRNGIVPDMIMNPHAIPSRMTIAQLLEMIFGKAIESAGAIGDASLFMNDETVTERISAVLQNQFAMEKYGNEILYNGQTGEMMDTTIFMGPVFTMRLKHMVEDKWNARAEGRREQRTHQPTGGRGNQGGLRIGEMERDAIACHGASEFLNESFMKRSDGTVMRICNGCGTVPIYNDSEKLFICPLCDGPVQYIGSSMETLQIMPPTQRSLTTASDVTLPYAMKVLNDELGAFMNMGFRILTGKHLKKLEQPPLTQMLEGPLKELVEKPLPDLVMPEARVPQPLNPKEEIEAAPEDLAALGVPLGETDGKEPEEVEVAPLAAAAGATPPEAGEGLRLTFEAPVRPLTPAFNAQPSPFAPPGYGPSFVPPAAPGQAYAGAQFPPPYYGGPPVLTTNFTGAANGPVTPQFGPAANTGAPVSPPYYGGPVSPAYAPATAVYGSTTPPYNGTAPPYGSTTPPYYGAPATGVAVTSPAYAPSTPEYYGGPASPPFNPSVPAYGEAVGAVTRSSPPSLNLGPAAAAQPQASVQVLAAPVPGGPVTLVVEGAGAGGSTPPLGENTYRGGGGGRRHHVTPRNRPARESRFGGGGGGGGGEGSSVAPSQRIAIKKMG